MKSFVIVYQLSKKVCQGSIKHNKCKCWESEILRKPVVLLAKYAFACIPLSCLLTTCYYIPVVDLRSLAAWPSCIMPPGKPLVWPLWSIAPPQTQQIVTGHQLPYINPSTGPLGKSVLLKLRCPRYAVVPAPSHAPQISILSSSGRSKIKGLPDSEWKTAKNNSRLN